MRIERALLQAALILAAPSTVAAAPLEPEACAALKTEYQGLLAAGAKSDMDRGPGWAKANLSPERLGKIERLIAVQEQLSFRCGELLTARPVINEPPPPEVARAGVSQSNIPLPKRKDASAAAAAKRQATKAP
ncbi:hypothetical protein [Hyphomicrobium sp.]|uniref:hypothetical protein n=1 Tax=Hyphomicrobium sp. TaxID=82 RepID=UPI0025B8054F|nr:hypothetical protein [Hyphomicrobium sp.]MCC7251414.1 hypothetical protein [Hyphomicrobium sp.]